MKPSFALVLTQDIIALLHRTSQGWHPVGEAAVADPDLTDALSFLRHTALGLDPNGVTSKLVIPNSEILYTTVQAPGPSASARRSQIRAALEGLTPYAVRDLVFDWSGSGPEVQVAVVARETLEEAEAFASQHRFGPLAFAGSPEPGQFDGEPWFGPAAAAESLLPPGEKVERDKSPVPLLAVPTVAAEPAPEIVASPDLPAAEEVAAAPAPMAPDAEGMVVRDDVLAARPVPPEMAAPVDIQAQPADPMPKLPAAPVFEEKPKDAVPPAEVNAPAAPVFAAEPIVSITSGAPQEPTAAGRTPAFPPDAAPPPLARPARAEVIASGLEIPAEPPATPIQPKGRSADEATAPAIERLKARLADQPIDPRRFGFPVTGPTPPTPSSETAPGAASSGTASSGVAQSSGARSPKAMPPLAAPARAAPSVTRPAAARVAVKGGAKGAASMVTSPGIPVPRDRRVNIPGSEAASDARAKAAAEARKTQQATPATQTAFGAPKAPRGKPKYLGLILTGLLLALLAAVAAWSSFIAADGQADAVPVAAASAPAPTTEAAPATDLASATDAQDPADPGSVQPEPALPDSAAASVLEPDPIASVDAIAAAPSETALAGTAPDSALSPADPPPGDTTLATSNAGDTVESAVIAAPEVDGQVGRNPPVVPQDEIFLAQIDPAVPAADLVALAPPAAAADTAPDPQPLPPPFGTVYRFDANGLILPTPEGIVTPEGVRLVLGKPSRVPPARPADAVPLPDAAAAELPAESPVAAQPGANDAAAASVSGVIDPASVPAADGLAADPALRDARPRLRPAELTPAPDDDAALPQSTDLQLTSLRPRERPVGTEAAAEAASASAAEAAAIQSASASLAIAAADAGEVSPFAISVSRKPAPRPRDFSKAVEAAVASIAQEPVAAAPEPPAAEPVVVAAAPEPAPKTTATAEAIAPKKPAVAAKPKKEPPPEEIDEPEVASAAPDLPTRANVAKQATFRNAINLSKVNLIGVYGSASNRHALVRQPNGRYVKVEVGDRVDGGKVAAISERELRYVKNGRTVTLAMPKG